MVLACTEKDTEVRATSEVYATVQTASSPSYTSTASQTRTKHITAVLGPGGSVSLFCVVTECVTVSTELF